MWGVTSILYEQLLGIYWSGLTFPQGDLLDEDRAYTHIYFNLKTIGAKTVIWEPPKIKSDIVSTVSPSISHEVMGLDAMIFVF